MAKGFLIDSDAVIGYLDAKIPARGMTLMHEVVNNIPNISIITKIEVLSFNAPEDAYFILTEFIDTAIVFDLTEEIVNETINLRRQYKIKTPDAIIAANAILYDLTLITRNIDDFKNVDNLDLMNPWNV